MTMKWEALVPKGKRGQVKVTCPECKEASSNKLKYNAEDNNHHAYYYCSLCKNQWDPSEVLTEEYRTARFRGSDGEWKYVQHTQANKERMKRDTNMWNPSSMKRSRDMKGKYAGGMNRKDVNMLKRLRKK